MSKKKKLESDLVDLLYSYRKLSVDSIRSIIVTELMMLSLAAEENPGLAIESMLQEVVIAAAKQGYKVHIGGPPPPRAEYN